MSWSDLWTSCDNAIGGPQWDWIAASGTLRKVHTEEVTLEQSFEGDFQTEDRVSRQKEQREERHRIINEPGLVGKEWAPWCSCRIGYVGALGEKKCREMKLEKNRVGTPLKNKQTKKCELWPPESGGTARSALFYRGMILQQWGEEGLVRRGCGRRGYGGEGMGGEGMGGEGGDLRAGGVRNIRQPESEQWQWAQRGRNGSEKDLDG